MKSARDKKATEAQARGPDVCLLSGAGSAAFELQGKDFILIRQCEEIDKIEDAINHRIRPRKVKASDESTAMIVGRRHR